MQEIQSPNQGKGNDNGNDNGQLCCRLSHNSSEILLTTLAALYYVTLTESACKKLIVMTMAMTSAMTMGRGHCSESLLTTLAALSLAALWEKKAEGGMLLVCV